MSVESDYTGELYKFVSQLATATGDLSKMTCPSFLLNGYSLLDYSLYWNDHPDLFYDICKKKDGEQMVAVMRWFVSTLYGSFHSRCSGDNSEKKPFNPALGESLTCEWKDTQNVGWGTCSMTVEQVSHHPPISAFAIKMPSTKDSKKPYLLMQGHCGQRTSFSGGAIKVVQIGRARITVHLPNNQHVEYTIFPLPEMSVAGLLSGKIFVELLGKSSIKCSNGFTSQIEFIPKGWFSGEYFKVKGHISSPDKQLYTLSGDWTKKTFIKGENGEELLFDATKKPLEKIYKPLEQQGPLESHKLWGPVTKALHENDYANASKLKTEIEEAQRASRKLRKEQGTTWSPKYFDFVIPTDDDLDGATERDPQQTGGLEEEAEYGHWLLKNQ